MYVLSAEPGKPFFVTMLLYVDEAWQLEWDAETMILDSGSNTGVFVRPAPGRMLLLDQVHTRPFSSLLGTGGIHFALVRPTPPHGAPPLFT
jgi:hypothetical protein